MRLFTGLAIPSHVIDALDAALRELRPTARLRWSPLENLHITSKFIGEWPVSRVPELQSLLAVLDPPGEFEVTVSRFGFLPNPLRPKIFFAGVQGEAGLNALSERTDAAFANLGVRREERPYTPHLTLARIGNEPIGGLRERIADMPPATQEFGSFAAREFHLYSSHNSIYSRLATYSLQRAAS
jgi:2'-5' RNA ligase